MRSSNLHKIFKPYYIFGVLLVLWFVVSKLEIWNAYLLPPPWKVANAFVTMWQRGEITASVLVSLRRVLIGLGISFALAFLTRLLTAYRSSKADSVSVCSGCYLCYLVRLIVNNDRHIGNYGFIVDNDTQKILRMAPVFDHNRSLAYKVKDLDVASLKWCNRTIGCVKKVMH